MADSAQIDEKESASDDDLLKEGLSQFKLCEDAEFDNRAAALDDLKFAKLGEQWPEAIKRQREAENRVCITVNKLPAYIRQVVNDSRQNKPSITFHPVEEGDVETAEVMNGLMRNIEYTSNADIAYDTAIDFAVSMGFGYIRVDTDYSYDDAFTQDIKIARISNPFSVYGDYESTSADGSDWKRAFVIDDMSKKSFKSKWPNAKTVSMEGNNESMEWFGDDSMRVAEWWKKEELPTKIYRLTDGTVLSKQEYEDSKELFDVAGLTIADQRDTVTCKITQRIMSGAEILETNEWAGKYIPIIPVYGDEVNVEGKRHFLSLIRFAKDAQQMHNFWRTASTELVALAPKAPYIGPTGSFDTDADKWATANTDTHAFIEYDGVDGQPPPQRQPFAGVPAGALQEAMNASDDMKSIMGLYDASMGAKSNETSGKAIIARQREGDVSTFHFIDNMTRAIRQVGRVCGDLIPKIYSDERMVRTIGEDGTNEIVKVNAEYEKNGLVKLHDLTAGKYDLIVKSGPSYTTRRQEAADQMMQLIQSFPDAAPIIGDLVAKNLDWPGADEIAKRLKIMLPPQLQQQEGELEIPPEAQQMIQQGKQQIQQMQQAMQQMQQENQSLKAGEMSKAKDIEVKGQTEQTKANAEVAKTQQEAELTKYTILVDVAKSIVLEAMKQAPDKQQQALETATAQMQQLLSPEDAQVLGDSVETLTQVAEGSQEGFIQSEGAMAPINDLMQKMDEVLASNQATQQAILTPRKVILEEDAQGKVTGGISVPETLQ
jgi:hypothetical protein